MAEAVLENNQMKIIQADFYVSGLDCPSCAAKLEKAVQELPGVVSASLNFASGKLKVALKEEKDIKEEIIRLVHFLGYEATEAGEIRRVEKVIKDDLENLLFKNPFGISLIISGITLLAGLAVWLTVGRYEIVNLFFTAGIIGGIIMPARNAWNTLVKLRSLDINALVIIAVIGAILIGETAEGIAVVFLYSLGNFLLAYTFDQTRNSIRSLMELTPKEALVISEEGEIIKPLSQIEIGDIVLVRPGQTIPVDGIVVDGNSDVDQSPLTGESVPVYKKAGDEVLAGTLNTNGILKIKATRPYKDTALQKIIYLLEESQAERSPAQQTVDRFASYYTPAVILLALLVAAVPPLLWGADAHKWIYQGLALLLIACPCALVISTPAAIVSALGNASHRGVLIKGGSYLEELGRIQAMAFDKTGTLTKGEPEVSQVILKTGDEKAFLSIAYALEKNSEHPLAQAITAYARLREIETLEVSDFQNIPGRGVYGIIDGNKYYIGNPLFIEQNGIDLTPVKEDIDALEKAGQTVVILASPPKIWGLIGIADTLRKEAKETVARLKKAGIQEIIMLTGDNEKVAASIADKIGLAHFKSGLLPAEKAASIKELKAKYRLAMVGDGINDAPALASADIGIAMRHKKTDIAMETADIVLMSNNLSLLPYIINLSRQTVRIIKQNILASVLIKLLIFLLIIPGMLTMWLAVVADVGTALAVTLNGMRLLKYREGGV
ncbi:Cd2+/Zn2+-exporting ATPase [Thermosyntropha lipolytica DSM 11003]|uniref:Cd(2+)-exporting ATPase n=1 Tax=Thermosyntropha lipolytica DSM 11003 TaxID=1123382 RepID=A0A1M5QIH2_9FIRM|nr:cation-translocating P-type ATPase [Thermosyntropha lipolytica]SHH13599.1 Cd2+/Zn2+-exporting ATPase [Thermosyntropha lipolytica DSM 11003]